MATGTGNGAADSSVFMQGWLTKRGGRFQSWKKRWFSLQTSSEGGVCLTYSESDSQKSIRSIPVSNINSVVMGHRCGIRFPTTDLALCFGLDTNLNLGGRIFFVCAPTENEAIRWKVFLWAALMRSGQPEIEQSSASALAKFTEANPKCVQALVDSGVIKEFARIGSSYPPCKDLYTTVLQSIGGGSGTRLPAPSISLKMNPIKEGQGGSAATADDDDDEVGDCSTTTSTTTTAPTTTEITTAATETPTTPLATSAPTGHGLGQSTEFILPTTIEEAEAVVARSWDIIENQRAQTQQIPIAPSTDRKSWQIVRVFVSSTFADMHSEREVLMRRTFPRLHAYFEPKRIRLVECDLRWGVPKDSSSEVVFRTCLSELDRCKAENGNPFFINLLGSRYGWIPGGEQLPRSIVEPYDWVDYTSITHMEILHGAYRTQNPNAAFFIRDPTMNSSLPEEFVSQFVDSQPLAVVGLSVLKNRLRSLFSSHVYDYTCEIDKVDESTGKRILRLKSLEKFEEDVYNFLVKTIEAQYPLCEAEETEKEKFATPHEQYLLQRTAIVEGIHPYVDDIVKYVEEPLETPGLIYVVHGSRGTGKATLLASAVKQLREKGIKVLYHTPSAPSTIGVGSPFDVFTFLDRVRFELENHISLDKVMEVFSNTVDALEEKFVIVIEGMDVWWDRWRSNCAVSHTFSKNFRFVCSYADKYSDTFTSAFGSIRTFETVPPPIPVRASIISRVFANYNKRLDPEQLALLTSNEGSANFGWITFACQELRLFGVFETVTARIRELKPTLDGLISQVIKRLLDDDTNGLLYRSLIIIAIAVDGISEAEMMDLLGTKEGQGADRVYTPIPMATWSPLLFNLRQFVYQSTDGLLHMFNHNLKMTVLNSLSESFEGGSREMVKVFHTILADYFEFSPAEFRRFSSFPRHLQYADDYPRILELRASPNWVLVSDSIRRVLITTVRCKNMIMPMKLNGSNLPTPERMCAGCANKMDYSASKRLHNRLVCYLCANLIHSENNIGKAPVLKASESLAVRCRQHNPQAYLPNLMSYKCFQCNMTYPTNAANTVSVIVCGRCTSFRTECVHMG